MTTTPRLKTVFRQCELPDVEAVQSLVDALYASDPNTQDVRPDVALTFQALSERPERGQLIVIEDHDRIVGYCIAVLFWSNEYGGNLIEIDEMYLVESHRASGITTELFAWLENAYPEQLAGFCLQVADHNRPALNFIEKMGFSPSRNQHFVKILT